MSTQATAAGFGGTRWRRFVLAFGASFGLIAAVLLLMAKGVLAACTVPGQRVPPGAIHVRAAVLPFGETTTTRLRRESDASCNAGRHMAAISMLAAQDAAWRGGTRVATVAGRVACRQPARALRMCHNEA